MSPNLRSNFWYRAKVISGKKLGRVLDFPTINLDNPGILAGNKEGVYACRLNIKGKIYQGVLYFGPRIMLKETRNVVEIFILDFNRDIYGTEVFFQLVKFIRKPRDFPDFAEFKKQLEEDSRQARKILLK